VRYCIHNERPKMRVPSLRGRASTLFVIIALHLVPYCVCAQGTDSQSGIAFPSVPGVSNLVSALYDGPIFDQSRQGTAIGSPTIYSGYIVENGAHVFHELENKGTPLHNLAHTKYYYPQEGFFVGLSNRAAIGKYADVMLEGWLLIPIETKARSHYVEAGSQQDISDTGSRRKWYPKTVGWFLDASVFYCINPDWFANGFSQVLGIRYDYYSRVMEQGKVQQLPIAGNNDRFEANLVTLVPYIGIEYRKRGLRYAITGRLLGSPLIWSRLNHLETFGNIRDEGSFDFDAIGGYWGELFLQLDLRSSEATSLGGFVKMSGMSQFGDSFLTSTQGAGATQRVNFDITYRRLIYIVGLNAALSFWSPL
jgi:hypothetical protein